MHLEIQIGIYITEKDCTSVMYQPRTIDPCEAEFTGIRSEFLWALAHFSLCNNEKKKHTKAQLLHLFV